MRADAKPALTMQSAWSAFHYVNGILFWKVTGRCAGYLSKSGYTQVGWNGRLEYAHRIIFMMFYGYLPDQVDHADGDKTNNRIENLRASNNSSNQWNRRMDRRNSSGFKGVHWHKQRQKWHAEIRVNNKKYSLGLHDTPEQAAAAYDDASRRMHGEYSLNNEDFSRTIQTEFI